MEIVLMPTANEVTLEDVERLHGSAPIIACDFHVRDVERDGAFVTGGYQVGRVLNIDHHAPTSVMARLVTSTHLAIERVRQVGLPPRQVLIVINHTDCDSVLSSAITAGRLPADDDFSAAALAADHTGEENALADMLQGLQHHRNYELSLRNVHQMRAGRPLDPVAAEAMRERKEKRSRAARSVEFFRMTGRVAYASLDEDTDSEFYPSLLPRATIILLAVPSRDKGQHRIMKLRLGRTAPDGLSLFALQLRQYDPGLGGRWNAGSNKRTGGARRTVEEYAGEISHRLEKVLAGETIT